MAKVQEQESELHIESNVNEVKEDAHPIVQDLPVEENLDRGKRESELPRQTEHTKQKQDIPPPQYRSVKNARKQTDLQKMEYKAVSKSLNDENYAKLVTQEEEPAQETGYIYRKAGVPNYFDYEKDKELFRIRSKIKNGPPEVHYQMSCKIVVTRQVHPR